MFGIFKDIISEGIETLKVIDEAATDIYRSAKETAEDMGVGPESVRDAIKDLKEL